MRRYLDILREGIVYGEIMPSRYSPNAPPTPVYKVTTRDQLNALLAKSTGTFFVLRSTMMQ